MNGITKSPTPLIQWNEDFDDGTMNDWTIENPAKPGERPITLELTTNQSHSSSYSLMFDSPHTGDPPYSGQAWGPMVSVNVNQPYMVEFWFRWNDVHWVWFVKFGYINILIDSPDTPLAFFNGTSNFWGPPFRTFCPQQLWTHFRFDVDPTVPSFTMTVNDHYVATCPYITFEEDTRFYICDPGFNASCYFDHCYYDDIAISSKNSQPNTPLITGPTSGDYRMVHEWNITATDPDHDDLYYLIDWGDGTTTGWSPSLYHSGETMVRSHRYDAKGTYVLKAKAKDVVGDESNWAIQEITMPYAFTVLFPSFWEKIALLISHAFPLLRGFLRL